MTEVLVKSEIRITQEVEYIVGRAREGSGRVVRLGQRVLFSTAGGDAWLLDREDGTALPLARAGERLPARVLENEERFVIEWTHDYRVRGESFVAEERASDAREVFTGYPTAELVGD